MTRCREVHRVAAPAVRAEPDASVGCPQMLEQQSYLPIRQPKRVAGEALLVRTLSEDPELAQPGVDTLRVPPIAVPADEELVPVPTSRVPRDPRAELSFRGLGDDAAVLLRRRRVSHRLTR